MPRPDPLSTAEIFNLVAEELEGFLKTVGGRLSRARDPFEVLELLQDSPGTFRVILMDDGDEPAGESARSGIVKMRLKVTVSHNRGLPSILGSKIARDAGDEPSLLARVGSVRERLRGMRLPAGATGEQLEYAGRTVVTFEGASLDAYEMTFTLFAALPAPDRT